MGKFIVHYMDGAEVSILDGEDNKIHFCETLYTDDFRFKESRDQTYVISCQSAEGRKVKFKTNREDPTKRAILVVETWAVVEIIFPGTVKLVINYFVGFKNVRASV